MTEEKYFDHRGQIKALLGLGNSVAFVTRHQEGQATALYEAMLQTGLPGQEDFGARLITAEVAGLHFTTVYCPNGKNLEHEDFPKKLAWFDALTAHLDALPAESPAVLCGDFNICPSGLDTWDESAHEGGIFHTDAERARRERTRDSSSGITSYATDADAVGPRDEVALIPPVSGG